MLRALTPDGPPSPSAPNAPLEAALQRAVSAPVGPASAAPSVGLAAPVTEALDRRLSVSVQRGQLQRDRAIAAVHWVDKEVIYFRAHFGYVWLFSN